MFTAKHTTLSEEVHVFRRENSRFWRCSTFLQAMNHRASTKVENLASAKEFAEGWYLTLCGKQRNGGLVTERTVTHAAEAFQKEYEVGRTKPRVFEEVTETE